MALAWLEYDGTERGHHRFQIDIGTNRWWSWAVGNGDRPSRLDGFKVLDERSHRGPLSGPLPPEALGRTVLEVPVELFDRENRHVQLVSFREQNLSGPAVSEIVTVPGGRGEHASDLEPIALGLGRSGGVRVVPFHPERKPVSTAMFLEALTGLLPQILPFVQPVLTGVLSGLGSGGSGGRVAPAGPVPAGAAQATETARLLTELIQRLATGGAPAGTAVHTRGPAAPAPAAGGNPPASGPAVGAHSLALSGGPRALAAAAVARRNGGGRYPQAARPAKRAALARPSRRTRRAARRRARFARRAATAYSHAAPAVPLPAARPDAAARAMSGGELSQAFIAPALLAALPALMPLLQSVLSPETIRNVLNVADPNRLIGTITNGIGDLAKIGQQGQKQEMEHLERLNPGTATPDLIQLLEGMSLSTALAKPAADKGPGDYRRIDGVTLHFADLSPQTLGGRPQTCFVHGSEMGFPLAVETSKPIDRARLFLTVRRPVSGKVVAESSVEVGEQIGAGRLPVVPTLPPADAKRLQPGEEYLVRATLVWPSGKKGRKLGTTMNQLISVVEPMTFDRLEQTGEVLALSDVQADREFWHKAWEMTFDDQHRKVSFACTYNYALDPEASDNAQMETVTDTEQSSVRHEEGTLRSGLVLGLYGLNKLLARSSHPQLGEDELRALATPEFVERFSQSAKTSVSIRGRDGDSAALWVYPEMKLPELVLAEAQDVNEFGQVLTFGERRVRFPVPAIAHFIGVRSR